MTNNIRHSLQQALHIADLESQLAEARAEIEAMQWPCTKCGSAWCYFDGAIVCSDCGRPIRDDIELARRKAALLDA